MIAFVILFLALIALDISAKYTGQPHIAWLPTVIWALAGFIFFVGVALVIKGVKGLFGKK